VSLRPWFKSQFDEDGDDLCGSPDRLIPVSKDAPAARSESTATWWILAAADSRCSLGCEEAPFPAEFAVLGAGRCSYAEVVKRVGGRGSRPLRHPSPATATVPCRRSQVRPVPVLFAASLTRSQSMCLGQLTPVPPPPPALEGATSPRPSDRRAYSGE
jgi:hypothetical protein